MMLMYNDIQLNIEKRP